MYLSVTCQSNILDSLAENQLLTSTSLVSVFSFSVATGRFSISYIAMFFFHEGSLRDAYRVVSGVLFLCYESLILND
jgi:hypothetical protein